ncbi:MAG: preprotein translocase subunit SecE [bacterium]|jgi:preprotein translocase subunit SecE|nr:preprotein translocase subunit SecE [Bacillota bacterium]HHW54927.1 preprotein translocase subunit SecE [Bacillota bacterium]
MAVTKRFGKLGEFGSRILKFLREVRKELGKVLWPSRSEVLSYTGVVLVTVVMVAALIWIVDSAVTQLLKFILVR